MLLALWLGLSTFGVTRWLALPLGLLGAGLLWTGAQRWRFARAGEGPGLVEVDERRLTYWGPLDGGTVDLDDLIRLDLEAAEGRARWLLVPAGGGTLAVPADAEGAEALLDLFAALPGLRTEAMLAALARREGGTVTLWRAPNVLAFPSPDRRRLH